MSEHRPRFFIFTESESRTIVLAKRADLDVLMINLPGIDVTEISTSKPLELKSRDFSSTFDPLAGLQSRQAPEGEELARFKLLKKKLEILFLTNNTVNLVKRKYLAFYDPKALSLIPIGGEAFAHAVKLAEIERDRLARRCDDFFSSFQEKIKDCQDASAVDHQFRFLQNNVTIGPFSFTKGGAEDDQRNSV